MTIKGPAIFLAQFAGDKAPFDNLDNISKWAADLGYKGVQIPTWDARMIDLKKASESKDYCDELKGICKNNNVEACSCIIVRRKIAFNRVKYSKECNVSSIMFSRKVFNKI